MNLPIWNNLFSRNSLEKVRYLFLIRFMAWAVFMFGYLNNRYNYYKHMNNFAYALITDHYFLRNLVMTLAFLFQICLSTMSRKSFITQRFKSAIDSVNWYYPVYWYKWSHWYVRSHMIETVPGLEKSSHVDVCVHPTSQTVRLFHGTEYYLPCLSRSSIFAAKTLPYEGQQSTMLAQTPLDVDEWWSNSLFPDACATDAHYDARGIRFSRLSGSDPRYFPVDVHASYYGSQFFLLQYFLVWHIPH